MRDLYFDGDLTVVLIIELGIVAASVFFTVLE